jgi:hypothetical protein
MVRLIVIAVAVCLIVGIAFPLAHEAYERHRVISRLDPVLSDQDRAAFQAWNGDAVSFAKSLYARCEITHGQGAATCEPYRLAQD